MKARTLVLVFQRFAPVVVLAALLGATVPTAAQNAGSSNDQTLQEMKQERDRLRRFGARMLNAKARELHLDGRHELALKLALAALPPESKKSRNDTGHAGLATLDMILRGPVWYGLLDNDNSAFLAQAGFSVHPGGRLLVAVSEDGNARIWDLLTGLPLRTLNGADGRKVLRAMFTPDGTRIVTVDRLSGRSSGGDGENPLAELVLDEMATGGTVLSVWESGSGALVQSFEPQEKGIRSVSVSEDGRQVITIDREGGVKRWLLETGEALPGLYNAGDQVREVLSTADGSLLLTRSEVTVTREATVEALLERSSDDEGEGSTVSIPVPRAVWSFDKLALVNGETGEKMWEIPRFGGDFQPLQFSPDNQVIFGINDFGWALLLDAATGETIGEYVREDSDGRISPIEHGAYSPDGLKIMTGHGDGTLRVWNATGGWVQGQVKLYESAITHVAFSPDAQWALSLSAEGEARLTRLNEDYTVQAEQPETFLKGDHGKLVQVRFTEVGDNIVGLTEEGQIHVWRTPDTKGAFVNTRGWKLRGQTLATPDGQWLLTTSLFPGIRFLRTDLWGSLQPLESQGEGPSQWDAIFASPDGKRIVTEEGGQVGLWDWTTGKSITAIGGGNLYDYVLGLSPDGGQVAIWVADDRVIRIIDTRDGSLLRVLSGFEKDVLRGVYSHDAKRLATASIDGAARLWDVETGTELLRLEHGDWVRHVAFSPDDTLLLTASRDSTARLWDVETGRELSRFNHADPINEAVFDKAAQRIATITERGTVHVWDRQTGRRLRTFYGNGGDWGYDMLIFDERLLAVLPHGMVYDASNDQTLMDLGNIVNFGLSPDGLWLAAYSENDIFLADVEEMLSQDQLANAARAMARDPLSDEETSAFHLDYWRESFGDAPRKAATGPETVDPCLQTQYDAGLVLTRLGENSADPPDRESQARATEVEAQCLAALKVTPRDGQMRLQLAAALAILGQADAAWEQVYMAQGLGRPEAEQLLDRQPGLTEDAARMTAYYAAVERTLALGAPEAAQVMAALLWQGGAGLPRDRTKSMALFRDAMLMGSARAHLRLADLYGVGVKPPEGSPDPVIKRDLRRALYHYAMAARLFARDGLEEQAQQVRHRRAYLARSLPRHLVAAVWAEVTGER